jgi:glutaredoxin
MWHFFRRLWTRRSADVRVILYTRQGCHLCETAWERLEQARRRYSFELTAVDVDSDPELVAQYGEVVPVVAVNGRVYFRGGVNAVLLERLLRSRCG